MKDEINPEHFELALWHEPLRFGLLAIIDKKEIPQTEEVSFETISLPEINCGLQAPALVGRGDLVRDETAQAREKFIRKHLFKKVWGLKGLEAINAFKVEFSILAGKTLEANIPVEALYLAYKAAEKRIKLTEKMGLELVLLWDVYFSHMSNEEIADRLKKYHNPSPDTIRKAVKDLSLPKSPGPVRIEITQK